jgi:hypothetical protein
VVPQQGIQTQVLKKRDGKWLIAYFQNTLTQPERPMPVAIAAPGNPRAN